MSKRILVADDEPDLCLIIKNALITKGFEVITASDGLQALQAAMQYLPDLIILDIMMPKMSGFQVCESLRKVPKFMDTPIMFLTAKDSRQDEEWGMRMGCDMYLTKPFDLRTLQESVFALLDRIRERKARPNVSEIKPDAKFEG